MNNFLVRAGQFSFRYRGYLLPIAVVLLLIPSEPLFAHPAPAAWIGLGLAAAGQFVRIVTIGLAYIIRGGKDHQVYAEELVTTGIYAHCRNPMYVANFFLAAGLAVASNSRLFLTAGLGISVLMHRAIVAAEEDFLRKKFGATYDDYRARVPRWLPRLAGLGDTIRSMQFDRQRVLVKEYSSMVDWLSGSALLALINVAKAGMLDEQWPLTIVCIAILVSRVLLWQLARRAVKQQSCIGAGVRTNP